MNSKLFFAAIPLAGVSLLVSRAEAQNSSILYSWNAAGVQDWFKNFGAGSTSATLSNSGGALQITETSSASGGSQAFSDGFNSIRDTNTIGGFGGLDLTGLSSLRFKMGHNGSSNVNVQFFVQASPGSNYVALGPDVAVTPGLHDYILPLAGLTFAQKVYVRTIGINIRDHAAQGNLTWTLDELLSIGPPLAVRDLETFDNGEVEGGLQGAWVNFDGGGVSGNSGQDQSGLSHNSNGSGSLQWTDLGGGPGGAIAWGNGSALGGNGFNQRPADLSNYTHVTYRMSATDPTGAGGSVGIQAYWQTGSGFTYQSMNDSLTIDGQFHDFTFSLAGVTNRQLTMTNGVNIFGHPQDLIINIDNVRYTMVPEPATVATLGLGALALMRRRRRAR